MTPEELFDLGTRLQREGRTAEAVAAYERLRDLVPENPLYRLMLAEALVELGSVDRAIPEFEMAACQLALMKRVKDAIKVTRRTLYLRPTREEVLTCAALLRGAGAEASNEALQFIRTILAEEASDRDLLGDLANALASAGSNPGLA